MIRGSHSGRSIEQLRVHYEVEKALAARLRRSKSWEERAAIYSTMYDELFAKVPDHPRLTRRADPVQRRRSVRRQLALLRSSLTPETEYAEIGGGTCELAFEVCKYVKRVRVIEIADQVSDVEEKPENFELIIYNGHDLDIPESTIDVVYSNQLVEHLHPDDAQTHFSGVHRILKPGGKYILITPPRLTGPHDVSQYFSDVAEGFHLMEWTYTELWELARAVGFSRCVAYWSAKVIRVPVPIWMIRPTERLLFGMPPALRRKLSWVLLPTIKMILIKQ